MITRRNLDIKTPCTLVLGIATSGERCAITGSVRTASGSVETEAIELVGVGLWVTLRQALEEARLLRVPHLLMLTNSAELIKFLTPPIKMQPTATQLVQPLSKKVYDGKRWVEAAPVTVPSGGCPDRWEILRLLFAYIWRVQRIESLPNTERLLQR